MKTHQDRVAVVTGAARGIGQAICHRLAERGAKVVGLDLLDMTETAHLVQAAGVEWMGRRLDVSSPPDVTRVTNEILAHFGRCEILVNNAGIYPSKPFDELTFEEWRRIMTVNIDSQFLMCRAVVGSMKAQGWGRIVNITSGSVQLAGANLSAYKASKMAVIGLTRGMSADLGQYGITVNAASPSITRTPGTVEFGNYVRLEQLAQRQAIKRVAEPDDVVGTILFLTSEDAHFVTGQTLLADGGLCYF
jgi:NAD(P)-dependent dehydrogenase (short-subunit alcohol dehydrogenase family)